MAIHHPNRSRAFRPLNLAKPAHELRFRCSPAAMQRFDPGVRMLAGDETDDADNVLNIIGVIGSAWWADVRPRDVQRRLDEIGARAVMANVNSPGGDFFDGQAIYNMLRMHSHSITVRILGIAASAASVVAMAGDRIEMPKASWLMIHNTWGLVIGNRHALREVADNMEKFDSVTADLYADRSGLDADEVAAMMDKDTFIGGAEAVEKGFADAVFEPAKVTESAPQQLASWRIEAGLRELGLSRSERRATIKEFRDGTPGAAEPNSGTPGAAEHDAGDVSALLQQLRAGSAALEQTATRLKG